VREFNAPEPGGRFSSRDLKDWLAETRRLGRWSVNGGTVSSDSAGMSLNIAGEDGFWAELTAESPTIPGRYSWKAVDMGTDGTAWVDADSGAIGNYATDMAREANSGAGLTGSVVWLYPAVAGSVGTGQDPEYYLFAAGSNRVQWSSGSAAPSGGVNGDWYYRTSNKFVYEKVAGVWTARSVTSSVITGITCVSGVLTVTTKTLTVFGDVS